MAKIRKLFLTCPMWLGAKARIVHVGFDDPPALARELAARRPDPTSVMTSAGCL
jgi:hypothetical protein